MPHNYIGGGKFQSHSTALNVAWMIPLVRLGVMCIAEQ